MSSKEEPKKKEEGLYDKHNKRLFAKLLRKWAKK